MVAYQLGTGEVPGSNPGKGENLSLKISNWIVRIWIQVYTFIENSSQPIKTQAMRQARG